MVVALLAWLATLLGQWQFHRLEDRREHNSTISVNLAQNPVPAAQLLTTRSAVSTSQEWTPVTFTGEWDDAATITVKYRTRDGTTGVEVLTPIVDKNNVGLWVNRGWMPATSGPVPATPAPTPGTVTVTGYIQADRTGGATALHQGQVRSISSLALRDNVSYSTYRGYVLLAEQTPPTSDGLIVTPTPDVTGEGPHLFYGIQWWFFGGLAIFGFFFLMYDEWKRRRLRPAATMPQRHR